MEIYFWVGVFVVSMIMEKLTSKYTNHVFYPLLSKTYNKNKFENTSKKRIDFLLQDKWNNFSLKLFHNYGCKLHSYCKKNSRCKLFVERKRRKTTNKKKNDCA